MELTYRGIEVPANEPERAEAVRSYAIVDTPPEQEFDDITELAAQITDCPVAYISIFDDTRSWLKSSYGLPPNRPPRPRELSMCSPTICQSDLLIVPDLAGHPRYADLPAVKNPPHARFYCAMPLINPEGYALGTLCVWDTRLKTLTPGQQQAMRRLARLVLDRLETRRRLLRRRAEIEDLGDALDRARRTADQAKGVVHGLFPAEISDRLLAREEIAPRFFSDVTVMFADFVDFSQHAEDLEPRALIEQLDEYFSLFDRIVEEEGIEKIKTVGDAYLAVAGMPEECACHAGRVCRAALRIIDAMDRINVQRRQLGLHDWPIRIGVHSGNVIAGVVGTLRPSYDVWGDGVNMAKRIQETAAPGAINISEATLGLIAHKFEAEALGLAAAKHKEALPVYRLLRRHPAAA